MWCVSGPKVVCYKTRKRRESQVWKEGTNLKRKVEGVPSERTDVVPE